LTVLFWAKLLNDQSHVSVRYLYKEITNRMYLNVNYTLPVNRLSEL